MTRAHGTRARYAFGPGPGRTEPCRCPACTRANREAGARRERMRLYGRWQPYTDAGPVREHLATLAAAGIGWKRAAQLSGVATGTVSRILYGGPAGRPPTRRVRAETRQRILAVRPAPQLLGGGALTDAAGTRRRVQALVACGYSQSHLAARLGVLRSNFTLATAGTVTAGTARAVRELYDELWDVPPDESGHRQKIAASRARNHAAARGWAPPMAWDDDAIDDPAAQPAEGWRRPARLSLADVADEAAELIAWEGNRTLAAERLGMSRNALDTAISRARRAS